MAEEIKTIDITPSDKGYERIFETYKEMKGVWVDKLLNGRLRGSVKREAIGSLIDVVEAMTEIKVYLKSKGIVVS